MSTVGHEPGSTGGDTFANMKPTGLYILLYKDHDEDIRFHWALYHFRNATEGGWKFDIIRPDGEWKTSIPYTTTPDPTGIDDTYGDGPLICALRLAYIENGARGGINELITREDDRLNEIHSTLDGGLDCRKYVQRACLRMPLPGFVGPSSWDRLEAEVLDLGELWRDDAGSQPVVVVDSRMAQSSGPNSDYESE